ncbi:MAG: hypothetical protein AAB834_02765 [Patescibacteria group bacterium]
MAQDEQTPDSQGDLSADDRRLIETITYMASLASETGAIDEFLDALRIVTARIQPETPLSDTDRARLVATRAQIADYLVNREPLRSFTHETLEQKITAHWQGSQESDPMRQLKKSRRTVLTIAVAALGVPLLVLQGVPLAMRVQLSIPLFLLALHLGTIWFYVSGLKAFTPSLHKVYVFICSGIFIIGIGAAQYPLISALSLEEVPIFRYGGIQTIFVGACVLIYWGVCLFAKLVKLKSLATSWPLVLAIVVLVTLASVLIPHTSYVPHEAIFDTMVASLMVCAVLLTASAWLVRRIRRSVVTAYASVLGWFFWALIGFAFGVTEYAAVTYMFGETYGLGANIAFAPYMVADLVLLQSGYVFKLTSQR